MMKQIALNGLFNSVRACGLMPALRALFGGRGFILSFHEIHQDPTTELETASTAAFLDYALTWLKRNGWEITSLDEGLRRLTQENGGQRFAIITFDDGYSDTVTRALPILESHDAPFTVFVPTGAPTRTLYCWWLGLRELFRTRDTVTIDAMPRRFDCPNVASKVAGLLQATKWVQRDLRASLLEPTFAAAGISLAALNEAYFLNESELKAFSRHPLVSIGAHTSSHAVLSTLDPDSVRREVSDNRSYLEQLLEQPIKHFAYPYGHDRACGEREATIVAEAGFSSAVTTRKGLLTAAHRSRPFFLPRIVVNAGETPASLGAQASGLHTAISRLLHPRRAAVERTEGIGIHRQANASDEAKGSDSG